MREDEELRALRYTVSRLDIHFQTHHKQLHIQFNPRWVGLAKGYLQSILTILVEGEWGGELPTQLTYNHINLLTAINLNIDWRNEPIGETGIIFNEVARFEAPLDDAIGLFFRDGFELMGNHTIVLEFGEWRTFAAFSEFECKLINR
jgi:hypothetical protein